jgi:hypothetical protein
MTTGNNSSNFYSKQHRYSTSESTIKKTNKRSNEIFYEQSVKRIRISSNHTDENLFLREDNELQSTLNVFDIFNQSDQIILKDNE